MPIKNDWNKLTYEEQVLAMDAANRLIGLHMIKDIAETFQNINLPLLYNEPGFRDKFCPDSNYFNEEIENYCWDLM